MDNLALPVPNTWQEVISILPELQRYGMNFYVNLAATGAFKGFGATMPFIYQYGGSIYSKDAFSAAINDPKSILDNIKMRLFLIIWHFLLLATKE